MYVCTSGQGGAGCQPIKLHECTFSPLILMYDKAPFAPSFVNAIALSVMLHCMELSAELMWASGEKGKSSKGNE